LAGACGESDPQAGERISKHLGRRTTEENSIPLSIHVEANSTLLHIDRCTHHIANFELPVAIAGPFVGIAYKNRVLLLACSAHPRKLCGLPFMQELISMAQEAA
jgi:hypothetical protein